MSKIDLDFHHNCKYFENITNVLKKKILFHADFNNGHDVNDNNLVKADVNKDVVNDDNIILENKSIKKFLATHFVKKDYHFNFRPI